MKNAFLTFAGLLVSNAIAAGDLGTFQESKRGEALRTGTAETGMKQSALAAEYLEILAEFPKFGNDNRQKFEKETLSLDGQVHTHCVRRAANVQGQPLDEYSQVDGTFTFVAPPGNSLEPASLVFTGGGEVLNTKFVQLTGYYEDVFYKPAYRDSHSYVTVGRSGNGNYFFRFSARNGLFVCR
ncbi:hypothetical protein K2X33_13950 [bacterium]|nr:hypothetical protein [bacterium]